MQILRETSGLIGIHPWLHLGWAEGAPDKPRQYGEAQHSEGTQRLRGSQKSEA
jgi:hypothetical protein